MNRDEKLRREAVETVNKNKQIAEQDPYRLHYHIMPPAGLLNDPNGFIQFGGKYHLYYQWMPFKTDHGAKFWGHYSSSDLVNWKHEEIALAPSEWFEKNGCYSGSAIERDGKLYVFYTGNVKNEDGNRETYQCLAVSEDGLHFDKKGPVLELPKGYTAHFRDPKVWKQDGKYFMVVGAQTADLKGAAALFSSGNLTDWEHKGIIAGGGTGKLKNFGYMFECPDLFRLSDKDILIFSPQGLETEGMKYQNVYQAGYVTGEFNPETGEYTHGDFDELDRGFDFYAPQTTEDITGRRLLFAWMSVPEQNEQDHPTTDYKWLHNMTLPRELTLNNGKVYQQPVRELEALREGEAVEYTAELNNETVAFNGVLGKAVELLIEDIEVSEGWFEISIRGNARLVYSANEKILTLERKSYTNGIVEKRQCKLALLSSLRLFLDTSSAEVFVNEGEETFTARFYPDPENKEMSFGASQKTNFKIKKWNLQKKFI